MTMRTRDDIYCLPSFNRIKPNYHPLDLEEPAQRKYVAIDECTICLDSMTTAEKLRMLSCGHFFHAGCINTWLQRDRSCPMDRREIAPLEVLPPSDSYREIYFVRNANGHLRFTTRGEHTRISDVRHLGSGEYLVITQEPDGSQRATRIFRDYHSDSYYLESAGSNPENLLRDIQRAAMAMFACIGGYLVVSRFLN